MNFLELFNTGMAHHQAGHHAEARAAYEVALMMEPDSAELLNNFGLLEQACGNRKESLRLHESAVAINPNMALAQCNLGIAYGALDRHDEALSAMMKALALDAVNPKTLNNIGNTLNQLGQFKAAMAYFNMALAIDPEYPEAHNNLAMSRWVMGDHDGAVESLHEALRFRPNYDNAADNLGFILLASFKFAEGWPHYERRRGEKRFTDGQIPRWDGGPIDGVLYVWPEQGVGDSIVHASMLKDLLAKGLVVMWETEARLVPLIQRTHAAAIVVPKGHPVPDGITAHIAAGSLGQYLRPVRAAFPDRRSFFTPAGLHLRLGQTRPIVGISWAAPSAKLAKRKSTKLMEWEHILRVPGCDFVSLQYGDSAAERAYVERATGVRVQHKDDFDYFDDLDSLATLIKSCDVVISVSNTTAHLACALGVPTTVLVPGGIGNFWYWGYDSDTTPWYPTAVVKHQIEPNSWDLTLRDVAGELLTWLENRPHSPALASNGAPLHV